MNVGIQNARHLLLLNGAHAAMWEENEHLDVLLPSQTSNRRASSVTGSSSENGNSTTVLAWAGEEVLKEVACKVCRE